MSTKFGWTGSGVATATAAVNKGLKRTLIEDSDVAAANSGSLVNTGYGPTFKLKRVRGLVGSDIVVSETVHEVQISAPQIALNKTAIETEVLAREGAIALETGIRAAGFTAEATARSGAILDEATLRFQGDTDEKARAVQAEAALQLQISSLLSNTDTKTLNSLAELVLDYQQNGQTIADRLLLEENRVTGYILNNNAAVAGHSSALETLVTQVGDVSGELAAYKTSNDQALADGLSYAGTYALGLDENVRVDFASADTGLSNRLDSIEEAYAEEDALLGERIDQIEVSVDTVNIQLQTSITGVNDSLLARIVLERSDAKASVDSLRDTVSEYSTTYVEWPVSTMDVANAVIGVSGVSARVNCFLNQKDVTVSVDPFQVAITGLDVVGLLIEGCIPSNMQADAKGTNDYVMPMSAFVLVNGVMSAGLMLVHSNGDLLLKYDGEPLEVGTTFGLAGRQYFHYKRLSEA